MSQKKTSNVPLLSSVKFPLIMLLRRLFTCCHYFNRYRWGPSDDEGIDEDGGERDWKWGGNSTTSLEVSISTFQILDEILLTLANKTLYPVLERVVFAGNSAGKIMYSEGKSPYFRVSLETFLFVRRAADAEICPVFTCWV